MYQAKANIVSLEVERLSEHIQKTIKTLSKDVALLPAITNCIDLEDDSPFTDYAFISDVVDLDTDEESCFSEEESSSEDESSSENCLTSTEDESDY